MGDYTHHGTITLYLGTRFLQSSCTPMKCMGEGISVMKHSFRVDTSTDPIRRPVRKTSVHLMYDASHLHYNGARIFVLCGFVCSERGEGVPPSRSQVPRYCSADRMYPHWTVQSFYMLRSHSDMSLSLTCLFFISISNTIIIIVVKDSICQRCTEPMLNRCLHGRQLIHKQSKVLLTNRIFYWID